MIALAKGTCQNCICQRLWATLWLIYSSGSHSTDGRLHSRMKIFPNIMGVADSSVVLMKQKNYGILLLHSGSQYIVAAHIIHPTHQSEKYFYFNI